MKQLFRLLSVAFVIAVFVSGCQKDGSQISLTPDNSKRIVLNNDLTSLSQRISYFADYDMSINDVPSVKRKSLTQEQNDALVTNYAIKLRAEVAPLTYNGFQLRATHVKIVGNYAYVSYNTEGPTYLGGIEVFDVTDKSNPKIISQALFLDTDIASIWLDNGKLYMAEAVDMDKNPSLSTPACLEVMTLDAGKLSSNTQRINLPSYVATDVLVTGNNVYVTTGNTGGLSVVNKTSLTITKNYPIADARSIDTDGTYVVVLKGTPGKIYVYNAADGSSVGSYDIAGATIADSKSTVKIFDGLIYAALNDGGMKVYKLSDGSLVTSQDRPVCPAGATPGDYVTNGVTVNNNLGFKMVLVANGAAGVWIHQMLDNTTLHLMGAMDFQSSTNFVEANNSLIFVATGFGGLKILEFVYYNPTTGNYITNGFGTTGVPTNLTTPVSLCSNLMPDYKLVFPEAVNLMTTHPEFFQGIHPTNLVLKEDVDLSLTFVSEGAGYLNVLGYYTYDAATPPTSVSDLKDMTIIFPNSSAKGSGGDLEAGMTVSLGHFKAGKVIGFFILSDGFKAGQITNGLYQLFSDSQLNSNKSSQNFLSFDITCQKIIMAFEDIKLPGGDKDFNDIVFAVNPSSPTAIDTKDFIKIGK